MQWRGPVFLILAATLSGESKLLSKALFGGWVMADKLEYGRIPGYLGVQPEGLGSREAWFC